MSQPFSSKAQVNPDTAQVRGSGVPALTSLSPSQEEGALLGAWEERGGFRPYCPLYSEARDCFSLINRRKNWARSFKLHSGDGGGVEGLSRSLSTSANPSPLPFLFPPTTG